MCVLCKCTGWRLEMRINNTELCALLLFSIWNVNTEYIETSLLFHPPWTIVSCLWIHLNGICTYWEMIKWTENLCNTFCAVYCVPYVWNSASEISSIGSQRTNVWFKKNEIGMKIYSNAVQCAQMVNKDISNDSIGIRLTIIIIFIGGDYYEEAVKYLYSDDEYCITHRKYCRLFDCKIPDCHRKWTFSMES